MADTQSLVERLSARFLFGLARLISGCHVRWLGCRPEARQRVYFANHSSHLDVMVLWAALPPALRERTRAVAGRDYWEGSAFRRWVAVRVLRCILIDRNAKEPGVAPQELEARAQRSIEQIEQAMGSELSLIIFPEGRRNPDGVMTPFKSGLYHLCRRRPDLELVPVYLENLNRILPKGAYFPIPVISSASFGAPMRMLPDEPKDAFLARAQEALLALRNP
jgi:1-acyl-sn-glycerol-3-phosphate acyltransferase